MKNPPRGLHGLALALYTIVVLLVIAQSSAGEGSWIEVTSHEDGGWVTSPEILVEGTATSPLWRMVLEGDDLAAGTFKDVKWANGNITFRPILCFEETFDGNALDEDVWKIVRDVGTIDVSGGKLTLVGTVVMPRDFPLVMSNTTLFPHNASWNAQFDLQFIDYPYMDTGGGIGCDEVNAETNHLAVVHDFVVYGQPWFRLYGNGKMVYNETVQNKGDHSYNLNYDVTTGRYDVLYDGEKKATYFTSDIPEFFWFGISDNDSLYPYGSIAIDGVDIWGFTGQWVSEPFNMDHMVDLEAVKVNWNTTSPKAASLDLFVRSSDDGDEWSDWVPFDGASPLENVSGTWLQAKLDFNLPKRNKVTNIQINNLELMYSYPIASVEVRKVDEEWTNATGLESWSAQMELEEDENTIEVRVIDTSGTVNITSFRQTVDTIPPAGTMVILGGERFTTDVEVTLDLNATDRHGVESVELSNAGDFAGSKTLPYASQVPWTIPDIVGEVSVYARFVDVHGLVSPVVTDTITYDSFPPLAGLIIEGMAEYTSSYTVSLELDYSDNYGIDLVELSNELDFSNAAQVPAGDTIVERWTLAEGADGGRRVYIRVTDLAGNTFVASDSIELYHAKAVGEIVIDDGATATSESIVKLTIDIPLTHRLRQMQIANDINFTDCQWESPVEEKLWILTPGEGVRRVYVRFLDLHDIVSLPVGDTIVVDSTPPKVSVTLETGTGYTIDPHITGQIDYDDASSPGRMWLSSTDDFRDAEPQPFSVLFDWTVPAREADHMVYVKVEDLAGNVATAFSSIHFATIHPEITVDLPGGHITNATDVIQFEVVYTDPYGGVRIRDGFDRDPDDDDSWVSVEEPLEAEIPPEAEDGPHEIRVKAKNAAELESPLTTVEVVLDRTPPEVLIIQPADGRTTEGIGLSVELVAEATDMTGIMEANYRFDGGEWTAFDDTEDLRAEETLDVEGDHIVEVRVVDRAGNRAMAESHFQLEAGRVQTISPSTTALLAILVMVLLIGAVYGVRIVRHRTTGPKVQPSAGQYEESTESPPDDGESEIVPQAEERDQGEAVEGLEPKDTGWEEY